MTSKAASNSLSKVGAGASSCERQYEDSRDLPERMVYRPLAGDNWVSLYTMHGDARYVRLSEVAGKRSPKEHISYRPKGR